MLSIRYTSRFQSDIKRMERRGKNQAKLKELTSLLVQNLSIPEKHRNHRLKGEYKDHWELHIEPDWLLIYLKTNESIILVRTGSHSDLF